MTGDEVMITLIASIKNMRKNMEGITSESPMMVATINNLKKASYISELEYKFCVALNCPNYPTGEGSPMFNTFLDFIELFFDKTDVVEDVRTYLQLLSEEDATSLIARVQVRLNTLESSQYQIQ